MTSYNKEEIQRRIIRAMSAFGVDHSLPFQSMSFIGFIQFLRDIPRDEVIEELKSMGTVFDSENGQLQLRIPTNYFMPS